MKRRNEVRDLQKSLTSLDSYISITQAQVNWKGKNEERELAPASPLLAMLRWWEKRSPQRFWKTARRPIPHGAPRVPLFGREASALQFRAHQAGEFKFISSGLLLFVLQYGLHKISNWARTLKKLPTLRLQNLFKSPINRFNTFSFEWNSTNS